MSEVAQKSERKPNTVETFTAKVYIAGDINAAKAVIRHTCYYEGLCVTVEPTTFIYTGGEEAGVVIGFVNYPRFPTTGKELVQRALDMMQKLIPALNQKSALLVASDYTSWMTIDPPGAVIKET